MGIFKKLFAKEVQPLNTHEESPLEKSGNLSEISTEDLEKTRTERGKEIAEKAKEELTQYWKKISFPKFKKLGNWFKNRMDTVIFPSIALGESGVRLASDTLQTINAALEKRKGRKEFIEGMREGKKELKQEAFAKRKMEIFEGFSRKMAKLLNIDKQLSLKTRERYDIAQRNINSFRNEIALREANEAQLEGEKAELRKIIAQQGRLMAHMDAVRVLPEIPIHTYDADKEEAKEEPESHFRERLHGMEINTYDADKEEEPELDFRERLQGDVTYLLQELTDDDYLKNKKALDTVEDDGSHKGTEILSQKLKVHKVNVDSIRQHLPDVTDSLQELTDITGEEAQEALSDDEEYSDIESIRNALKEEERRPLFSSQYELAFIPSNEELAQRNQGKKKAA